MSIKKLNEIMAMACDQGISEFVKLHGTHATSEISGVIHYQSNINEIRKFIVFENRVNRQLSAIFDNPEISIDNFIAENINASINYSFRDDLTEISIPLEGKVKKMKAVVYGKLIGSSGHYLIQDTNGSVRPTDNFYLTSVIFEG